MPWSGRKTIEVPAGTSVKASRPERLSDVTQQVTDFEVFALSSNTDSVWVGFEGTNAVPGHEAGVELAADASYVFGSVDLRDVYVSGTTDGDGVVWNAF